MSPICASFLPTPPLQLGSLGREGVGSRGGHRTGTSRSECDWCGRRAEAHGLGAWAATPKAAPTVGRGTGGWEGGCPWGPRGACVHGGLAAVWWGVAAYRDAAGVCPHSTPTPRGARAHGFPTAQRVRPWLQTQTGPSPPAGGWPSPLPRRWSAARLDPLVWASHVASHTTRPLSRPASSAQRCVCEVRPSNGRGPSVCPTGEVRPSYT